MHVSPQLTGKDVLHDRLADAVASSECFLRDATGAVRGADGSHVVFRQLASRIAGAAIRVRMLLVVAAKRCEAQLLGTRIVCSVPGCAL